MTYAGRRLALTVSALVMVGLGAACTGAGSVTPTETPASTPAVATSEPAPQTSDAPAASPTASDSVEDVPDDLFEELPIDKALLPVEIGEFVLDTELSFDQAIYSRGALAEDTFESVTVNATAPHQNAADYASIMEDVKELEAGKAYCGVQSGMSACVFDSANHGTVHVTSLDAAPADLEPIMEAVRPLL
ncbi:hypothetical protein [Tessaracoccus sp. ZS01]|uniref:hypothetical protein n=1 Tax=Tessaracoccus sp. ZS01 TaxID=1906324 RepID=UPI00096E3B58|nr:hypothetical protein [Tessaracoccus sp. ZS01]MCG6568603.1 hypothetical protein [Tessaracoccus sp. ZS01]OMG52271.1 hypothetical protein BJN44_13365 [Tessaracoccus sp. ZS01]